MYLYLVSPVVLRRPAEDAPEDLFPEGLLPDGLLLEDLLLEDLLPEDLFPEGLISEDMLPEGLFSENLLPEILLPAVFCPVFVRVPVLVLRLAVEEREEPVFRVFLRALLFSSEERGVLSVSFASLFSPGPEEFRRFARWARRICFLRFGLLWAK